VDCGTGPDRCEGKVAFVGIDKLNGRDAVDGRGLNMNKVTSRIDINGREPADGAGGEIGTNVEAAMEEALDGTEADVVRVDLLGQYGAAPKADVDTAELDAFQVSLDDRTGQAQIQAAIVGETGREGNIDFELDTIFGAMVFGFVDLHDISALVIKGRGRHQVIQFFAADQG